MKLLRWLGFSFALIILAAVAAGVATRFSDGPLGPFPGGPLEAGVLVTEPTVDWSRYADVMEVELGLDDPPRSRTTWLLVHEGEGYIPCGFPNLRLFKQWPHEVLADGRVTLRVEGRRYPRRAVRINDPQLFRALTQISQAKYGLGEGSEPNDLWIFRLDPRPSS